MDAPKVYDDQDVLLAFWEVYSEEEGNPMDDMCNRMQRVASRFPGITEKQLWRCNEMFEDGMDWGYSGVHCIN